VNQPSNTAQAAPTVLKSPAEVAVELYNVLLPYPSEVRQRAIQAAMTSLGESVPLQSGSALVSNTGTGASATDFADLSIGPKATKWLQRHGISREMLDEVFHVTDSGVDIIATGVPGASKRERAVNCYLLSGLRGLLESDAPSLDEGDAITVCRRLTAYDKNNHTANRASIGNRMSGTRPTFTLTGPGESAAAQLVKQMTASQNE
jgi:hypothetical protein